MILLMLIFIFVFLICLIVLRVLEVKLEVEMMIFFLNLTFFILFSNWVKKGEMLLYEMLF